MIARATKHMALAKLEMAMVKPAAKKVCTASVLAVKRIAVEGNIGE